MNVSTCRSMSSARLDNLLVITRRILREFRRNGKKISREGAKARREGKRARRRKGPKNSSDFFGPLRLLALLPSCLLLWRRLTAKLEVELGNAELAFKLAQFLEVDGAYDIDDNKLLWLS